MGRRYAFSSIYDIVVCLGACCDGIAWYSGTALPVVPPTLSFVGVAIPVVASIELSTAPEDSHPCPPAPLLSPAARGRAVDGASVVDESALLAAPQSSE